MKLRIGYVLVTGEVEQKTLLVVEAPDAKLCIYILMHRIGYAWSFMKHFLAESVLAQPVLAQPVLAQPVLAQPALVQAILAQALLAQAILAQAILAQEQFVVKGFEFSFVQLNFALSFYFSLLIIFTSLT